MKKNFTLYLKHILLYLGLIVISCDNNELEFDQLPFGAEIELKSDVSYKLPEDLNIRLFSESYKPNLLNHTFTVKGTKNFAIIKGSDTIRANEDNEIAYDGKWQNYKYYSKEIGENALTFIFQNSKKYSFQIEKKVNVKLADYIFEATASNLASINVPKPIKVKLEQSNTLNSSIKYKVKYAANNILGVLKDAQGNTIEAGKEFDFVPGTSDFIFTPSSASSNGELVFSCVDSFQQKKESKVSLNVSEKSFDFSAIAEKTEINLNDSTPIAFKITPFDSNSLATYSIKFISSGEGSLGGFNSNSDYVPLSSLDFSKIYNAKSVGDHKIVISIKDSFGIVVSKELIIKVIPRTFSLTAVATNLTPNLGETSDINFSISPKIDGQNYKLKYSIIEGTGVFYNNGNVVDQNSYIDVENGDFTKVFKASKEGQVTIVFTAKNTDGYEQQSTVTLNVATPTFTFSTTAQASASTLGNAIKISYSLLPSVGAQTFQVKFDSGSSEATLNGYQKGVWFETSQNANGEFSYIPSSIGSHSVTVTAKNQFGVEKSATFQVNVTAQAFEFTASSSSNTGTINTAILQNFNLSAIGNDTGQTYQMQFINEEGSGTLNGQAAGTWFSVNKGAFNLNYLPTSAGNHKINYKVRNTAGTEVTKSVDIAITQPTFDFSGSPVKASGTINEEIDVNFALNAVGNDLSTSYQLQYTDSGQQSSLGGNQQGTWFNVSKGNFVLKFKGLSVGEHNIVAKVKNGFGVEKTVSFLITVANYDFNFTAASENTVPNINENSLVNFNVSPIGEDSGQNYSMKYELISGQASVNGFSVGVYREITKGNFSFNIVPLSSGTVTVKFTTKNSAGTTKEQIITLNVATPTFTFSTTAQASATTLGNAIKISYSLLPSAGTQTFQVKFDSGSAEGTLNGYQKGVWFETSQNANGEFSYIPSSIGTHSVTVTAKNQFGVEKSATFQVNVAAQNFEFTASSSSNTGTINTAILQNFNLSAIGNDSGQTYQMQFINEEGSGTLNGQTAGTWFSVNKGAFNFNYLPTSAGNHKINFKVRNTAGTEVTKSVDIAITQPTFDFSGTPVKASGIINEEIDVNFALNAVGNDLSTSYQLQYTDSGQQSSLGGNQQGTWFSVSKGNFVLKFKGLSVGEHNIVATLKNGFGVEKTVSFKIVIANYDFAFTAVASNLTPSISTAVPFNFNITSLGSDQGQTYSMKYELMAGQASMSGFSPGVFREVTKGDFAFDVVPTSNGQVSIKFTVKNTAGTVHEQIVNLTVGTPDYTFSTTAQQASTTLGNPITVSYSLIPSIGSTQTYQVKFDGGSSEGTLNGYQKGVWFDVSANSNGTFTYSPNNVGSHSITVTAKSNFGVEKSATFNVNVAAQNFEFTAATSSATGTINTPIAQQFAISSIGNDSGQQYQMQFMNESGSGTLNGNQAGAWFTVNKGNFSMNYLPTSQGSHRITYKVRNTAGTEVTKSVDITVTQPDFNITANPVKASAIINESVDVNFALNNLGDDLNTTYQMQFVDANQQSTIGGNQQGTWFNVSKGNFTLPFVGLSAGEHNITIKVKNGFNVEKTATFKITVANYDFAFTAVATNSNPIVNVSIPVNMNISPIGNDDGQTYMIKYEVIDGNATVDGLSPGVFTTINKGDFIHNVKPTSTGQVTIKFTTKNLAGAIHDQTINLTVGTPDYTFSTTAQQASTILGNPITVSYSLLPSTGSTQSFQVKFDGGSAEGTLNGYQKGVWFNISENSNGTLTYNPTNIGNHDITVTVRSNYGIEKTSTFTIQVISKEFDFNVSTNNLNMFVNQPYDILSSIVALTNDDDQTYSIKYELIAGDGIVDNKTKNVFYTTTKGTTTLSFTPTSLGTVTVLFTVKNTDGITKQKTMNFNVSAPTFDFVSFIDNAIYNTDQNIPVNYKITPQSNSNQNFEIMFKTNFDTATLEGYVPNTWYSITELEKILNYKTKNGGDHLIELSIRNQFGVQKNITLNKNVLGIPNLDLFDVFQFNLTRCTNTAQTGKNSYLALFRVKYTISNSGSENITNIWVRPKYNGQYLYPEGGLVGQGATVPISLGVGNGNPFTQDAAVSIPNTRNLPNLPGGTPIELEIIITNSAGVKKTFYKQTTITSLSSATCSAGGNG